MLRRSWDDSADYEYVCPVCTGHVRRPLGPEHVETLITQGARVLDLDDSAGSAITLAEILAFTRKLSEPGALEAELGRLAG